MTSPVPDDFDQSDDNDRSFVTALARAGQIDADGAETPFIDAEAAGDNTAAGKRNAAAAAAAMALRALCAPSMVQLTCAVAPAGSVSSNCDQSSLSDLICQPPGADSGICSLQQPWASTRVNASSSAGATTAPWPGTVRIK